MYPDEKTRAEYMEERCRILNSGVFCDRHNTGIVTASGETRTVCWNCYKLADEAGGLCGAIALAFDVTGKADGGGPDADLKEYVIRALEQSEA
jgi:hypothetical protein